jgi:ferredoxin
MTRIQVWRGDETGGKLRLYDVEVNEGEVVLDVVHRLQATQAPDLAVRWNCKAGKCGSCSAEVNGRPRLMCMTRMNTFDPAEVLIITPLRGFPVIKDLVTDVSYNYAKARAVPSFVPPPDLAALVALVHRLLDVSRVRGVQVTTGDVRPGRGNYVHARSGRPCLRCGTAIRLAPIGVAPQDRVAFYCPNCQRGPAPTDGGRPQRPLGASRR